MCAECSYSLGSEISDPLKLKLQAVVSYQMYGFIPIAVIKCPETKQLVRRERKLSQPSVHHPGEVKTGTSKCYITSIVQNMK